MIGTDAAVLLVRLEAGFTAIGRDAIAIGIARIAF